ncbi:MAG: tetratricopeptide repeat protein [Gemmatimonadaceae bacterium]
MQGSARIDELRQKFHENPRRYFAPLANEYRKAGDPEQAIAICKAHLAQQPGHMSGHVVYAQSLHDAGRIDESLVVFEKALSLDPDNAIVLRRLGDISRQRGDPTEARHWYSRALETDPHDREVAAYIAELTEPLTESDQEAEPPIAAEPLSAKEQVTASESRADEPTIDVPVEEAPVEEAPVEEASIGEAPEDESPVEEARVANEVFAAEPLAALREEAEPTAPETAAEPNREVTPLAWELADEASDDEVETATTPLTTGSPFVTRTMADLYARQGYHEQALEVYRELAAANPDDADIAERVRELSAASEVAISSVEFVDALGAEEATAETSASPSKPANEFAERV